TGRAGHIGRAISFASPDQGSDVVTIEKLIRSQLPVSKHPDMPSEQFHGSGRGKPAQKKYQKQGHYQKQGNYNRHRKFQK
ncbi:MAG: hypothetical protein KKH08_06685, partial [Candidatus Omnitrophica bacterium]|nr:hypothetical protein [Candidatus Omnitrophota bacterium]